MATYNEIIKILRDYSEANFVIKSFGNGDESELVETFGLLDLEYPKMWAQDMPNTTTQGEESFKFRIYMLGQVATLKEKTTTTLGEDNTNEVKSNMRQNCLDLLSYLLQQTNYPEITTDKNVTLTSFVGRTNDKLTGWYFDLNVRQAFSFSACVIPMDGIAPPPSTLCGDSLVENSDGTYSVNVASGGTLILPDVVNIDSDGTPTPTPAQTPFICSATPCEDGVVTIEDENNTVLHVVNVASGGAVTEEIADSNVANSDFTYNASIFAEGNLILPDITHTQTDGSPETLPAQTPLICNAGSTPLPYRAFSGQTTQYQIYDDGYYFQAGYYGGGILSDYYNLSSSGLTPWSHLKRFTGTTGGYKDETTGIYHNEDGTVSGSHALSFPDGLINDYLNGYQWYYLGVGSRTWTLAVSEIQSLTFKGFSDWILPSKSMAQEIEDNEFSNPFSNGIFSITGDFWSGTTVPSNTLQAFSFNVQGESRRSNKTLSKFRVVARKF